MRISFSAAILSLPLLCSPACQGGDGGGSVMGEQAAEIVSDTQIVKQAQAAANEIIRNAPDCDFVKNALPEVRGQLEAARREVQTGAGRTTLDALAKQVTAIAEACGAR